MTGMQGLVAVMNGPPQALSMAPGMITTHEHASSIQTVIQPTSE